MNWKDEFWEEFDSANHGWVEARTQEIIEHIESLLKKQREICKEEYIICAKLIPIKRWEQISEAILNAPEPE